MKVRHILMLGLSSLVMISCVQELQNTQLMEKAVAIDKPANIISRQATSLAMANMSKSGNFISGEHPTEGVVSLITKNGKSLLEFEQTFKTSASGPDLVIVLHRSDNVIASTKPPAYPLKKGDYIIIAPLKKYRGTQTYTLPNNINLAEYKSVAIWCRKFNATFGAANLSQ
ncbi:DM13 domain-containing protein [Nostoc sp. TCL26-01]|uniref:DM13 domain-containing protein n=1 Tax=Nostoc sp. TCL26-01 TaxID=2576904 RepID=UPI0015C1047A|nr:DM13 domain-containing protein [Nostoc sp. TCL26-01]QLE55736.1 DM13 domain-containing protein [Nostoc sp. TCL26-01]